MKVWNDLTLHNLNFIIRLEDSITVINNYMMIQQRNILYADRFHICYKMWGQTISFPTYIENLPQQLHLSFRHVTKAKPLSNYMSNHKVYNVHQRGTVITTHVSMEYCIDEAHGPRTYALNILEAISPKSTGVEKGDFNDTTASIQCVSSMS